MSSVRTCLLLKHAVDSGMSDSLDPIVAACKEAFIGIVNVNSALNCNLIPLRGRHVMINGILISGCDAMSPRGSCGPLTCHSGRLPEVAVCN
jgi:hypothetical protein